MFFLNKKIQNIVQITHMWKGAKKNLEALLQAKLQKYELIVLLVLLDSLVRCCCLTAVLAD